MGRKRIVKSAAGRRAGGVAARKTGRGPTRVRQAAPMTIETRQLMEIKPYPGNPRVNDQAVAAVAESIRRFGFRQPIVVDGQGVIICGHTRWKAAQKLGLDEVPVHVAADLTPEQVRLYRLADNRVGELADWNLDLLMQEVSALREHEGALDVPGFSRDELNALLLDADLRAADEPESVKTNLAEMKGIRAAGNKAVVESRDTEHYLVLVFPSRQEREQAAQLLGLDPATRYVSASDYVIIRRAGKLTRRAAAPNKSGSCG